MQPLWTDVLSELSNRISKPSFDTWFRHTSMEIEDHVVFVQVGDAFSGDWILSKYTDIIIEILKDQTGETYKLDYLVTRDLEETPPITRLAENKPNGLKDLQERVEYLENKVQQLVEKQQLEGRIQKLEKLVQRLEMNEKC